VRSLGSEFDFVFKLRPIDTLYNDTVITYDIIELKRVDPAIVEYGYHVARVQWLM